MPQPELGQPVVDQVLDYLADSPVVGGLLDLLAEAAAAALGEGVAAWQLVGWLVGEAAAGLLVPVQPVGLLVTSGACC